MRALRLVAAVLVVLAFWLLVNYWTQDDELLKSELGVPKSIIPAVPEEDFGMEV